jgi:hypothetical protein
VRRRRRATTAPDFLFAVAAMGVAMAAVFVAASFSDDNLTAGEAGQQLARLFAASLFASAALIFLLGFLLLRDERNQADHYVIPVAVGLAAGAMEAFFFLEPAGMWLLAPFALLVLALRPVRRSLAGILGRGGGG